MTKVQIPSDPGSTPEEEAELVARVAAAYAEASGGDDVIVELVRSERVSVGGTVADRMHSSARWSA